VVKSWTHTVLRPHLWAEIGTPAPNAATLSTVKATPSAVVMPAASNRDATDLYGRRPNVNVKNGRLVIGSRDVVMRTPAPVE
jgi:hypothetical protein